MRNLFVLLLTLTSLATFAQFPNLAQQSNTWNFLGKQNFRKPIWMGDTTIFGRLAGNGVGFVVVNNSGVANFMALSSIDSSYWRLTSGNLCPKTLSNNVGIGLSNPSYPLDVLGDLHVLSLPSSTTELSVTDAGISSTFGGGQVDITGTGTHFQMDGANAKIILNDNPGDGNVGIGTPTPSYKLQVNDLNGNYAGSFGTSASCFILQTQNLASDTETVIQTCTAGQLDIRTKGGDIAIQNCPSCGNVGIGTASPLAKLHVKGASGDFILLEDNLGTTYIEGSAGSLHIASGTSEIFVLGSNELNIRTGLYTTTADSSVLYNPGQSHALTTKWDIADSLFRIESPTGDTIAIGGSSLKVFGDDASITDDFIIGSATFTDGGMGDGKLYQANSAVASWVTGTPSMVSLGNVPNTDCTNASNISSGTLPSARLSANVAQWVKVTKTFTQLSAASLTNDISLYTLPISGYIHDVKIVPTTAFSGGLISAYTISVGITGNLTKYAVASNVFTGNTALSTIHTPLAGLESTSGTTDIRISAISVTGLLSAATAGSVDVYLYVSTLP